VILVGLLPVPSVPRLRRPGLSLVAALYPASTVVLGSTWH